MYDQDAVQTLQSILGLLDNTEWEVFESQASQLVDDAGDNLAALCAGALGVMRLLFVQYCRLRNQTSEAACRSLIERLGVVLEH